MTELTRDQANLLLYFETRLVDHGGRVDCVHMNAEDISQAKAWSESGYVDYGRIVMKDCNSKGAMWIDFSNEAWEDAHRERRARACRMINNRNYVKTEEKRA